MSRTYRAWPHSYETAAAFADSARSPILGKPLANNTRVFRRGPDAVAVRLHRTDVVTFHADGRVILNSGGWQTSTTLNRMQNCIRGLSKTVFQRDFVWYVGDPRDKATWEPYRDGVDVGSALVATG